MTEYLDLTPIDVAASAVLILAGGLVSVALRLQLTKPLLIASLRTVIQLLILGMALSWIFRIERWYLIVAIAAVMTLIAGLTAAGRSRSTFLGMRWISIAAVWLSAWLTVAYGLTIVLRGLPQWHEPQYAIPLLGMVLGNTLNSISLALNTLTESLIRRRDQIETLTAFGATRFEAAAEPMREAVRTGMIPIINSMMIVGLVSLPGMMTGQLVSGMEPGQAVRYQIVIMFLIAGATAIGTSMVVVLAVMRLFAADHRFQSERLKPR